MEEEDDEDDEDDNQTWFIADAIVSRIVDDALCTGIIISTIISTFLQLSSISMRGNDDVGNVSEVSSRVVSFVVASMSMNFHNDKSQHKSGNNFEYEDDKSSMPIVLTAGCVSTTEDRTTDSLTWSLEVDGVVEAESVP